MHAARCARATLSLNLKTMSKRHPSYRIRAGHAPRTPSRIPPRNDFAMRLGLSAAVIRATARQNWFRRCLACRRPQPISSLKSGGPSPQAYDARAYRSARVASLSRRSCNRLGPAAHPGPFA
jgi:hypothetical protein